MIMSMKDFPDLNHILPLPAFLQTNESNLSQFLFIGRSESPEVMEIALFFTFSRISLSLIPGLYNVNC